METKETIDIDVDLPGDKYQPAPRVPRGTEQVKNEYLQTCMAHSDALFREHLAKREAAVAWHKMECLSEKYKQVAKQEAEEADEKSKSQTA